MRRGRKNRTSSRKPNDASASSNFVPPSQEQICYEGESLAQLIKSIQREMESARLLDTTLPHKIWIKAILLASDCNPRWLMRHLPSMASSRKVPLIFVKDKKGGSVRLGELVKLKTAIAIGVKVKGNAINQCIEEILHGNEINFG
ncbi:hypothetical protein CsSME_00047572 [Camellia sinensis var. sinensis]